MYSMHLPNLHGQFMIHHSTSFNEKYETCSQHKKENELENNKYNFIPTRQQFFLAFPLTKFPCNA